MTAAVSVLHQAPVARMREVFERQRHTALRLRTSTVAQRKEKIRRLRDAMIKNMDALREAGWQDFRRPPAEVDLEEVLAVTLEANDALRNLKGWMKPHRVFPTPLLLGTRSYTRCEPRGTCLIISPWNYPVNLTFGPLVSALAAGNTAMLKPSEMTPHFSAVMVRMVAELFPEDEVAIFEGEAHVSQALLELPFDHIFFTGSPAVGKMVMAAAAKNLTSVTLELGGKSPTIVDETADLALAAHNVMFGKFTNGGQTCIAPDHVYVHASVKDDFAARCKAIVEKAFGNTPDAQAQSPYMAHVVNARHHMRLVGLLEDARAQGAKVLVGGTVDASTNFVAPTLLGDIPPGARIMQEEVFGPILPVLSYTSLDDVIGRINADPKPLALYVFSRNEANIQKVLTQTSSGGACVNHSLMQFLHGNLPFGGVNNSGIGNSHGHAGFKAFSHERSILRTQFSMAATLFGAGKAPPSIHGLITSLLKWL